MKRILVALAVGAGIVIGAAPIFRFITEPATDARSADFEFDAGGPAREHGAPASAPTDDRATTYRRVAAASRSDIDSLVTKAAAERPSARRTAELEALLDRFAELDATAAIGVARRLRLGIELVAPLYGAWYEYEAMQAAPALKRIFDAGRVETGSNDAQIVDYYLSQLLGVPFMGGGLVSGQTLVPEQPMRRSTPEPVPGSCGRRC